MTFDVFDHSMRPAAEAPAANTIEDWYRRMLEDAQERKARVASERRLSSGDLEALARQVFEEYRERALDEGVRLPDALLPRLLGDLSGLGPLLALVQDPEVEDVAVNYGHMYVYRTGKGWQYHGPTPEGFGTAMRALIDAAGYRPPMADTPITDAMLQVLVPSVDGKAQRAGLRVNYVMPPASPYGDVITIRIARYRSHVPEKPLSLITASRLPPARMRAFEPVDFPDGKGVLSPEAANYLLAVLYRGQPVVVAGATGSGKTFTATLLLQSLLNLFPKGALRLFVIEDTSEILLNGWSGDPAEDTGNVVYTLTRPEPVGEGPPAITMYDLIRAALRSRPHGIVVGEARGAEAWELIRATATGHGYSVFSIHATSAEQVWPRFLQAVQAHPDVRHLTPGQVAQAFAEGVAAVVFLARHPQYGQVALEVAEVAPVVEREAGRPAFNRLFEYDPTEDRVVPTGNRPMRLTEGDLNLPAECFMRRRWV